MMDKLGTRISNTRSLPGFPTANAWERAWQKHWSKVGMPGYELPVGGRDGDDREFLTHARTPDKERARLKRINDEFIRGFKGLFHVGPAVTVFGSARFKATHPYYTLVRATGAELAKAGFATLTGGGPGKPGADGKLPNVGNTVDVENATWKNTIGAPELITVWKDPDFDAKQRAFYYVRVIEIPTPRWTAYDAKKFGTKPLPGTRMTTQERAYTSPIWYNPAK